MRGLLLLALLCAPSPVAAHGDASLWSDATWTYDPWIIVPLYGSAALYFVGTQRLWRRAGAGRGVRYVRAACFWTGWLALALALVSPLHWAGERLFTAHMIEHAVVMAVGAPLIAAARPLGAMLWGLPRYARAAIGKLRARIARWLVSRALAYPLVATAVHGFAIWAWHAPPLYEAALNHIAMHRLQHMSFFLTAVLFWWSLWHGRLRERGYGIAFFCLFLTSVHTGVLGILLTLSRRLWYPGQEAFAAQFGLTPLEDQQLAGLVMGVPMGLIYTGVALVIAARWIATSAGRGWPYAVAAR